MSSKPLAIDLFCGLGGWTSGLLAEGYRVFGFDIERHVYGEARYPAQLVLQDVRTIHGRQFRDAALIVASPPCQEYSYMAMPWKRGKAIAAAYRSGERDVRNLTALFDACFRIQREACEAAGRHVPLVVENVRGAQAWVGRAGYRFGSFYLWGDVPALMPIARSRIGAGGVKVATMGAGWYPPDHPKHVSGLAFNGHAERNLRDDRKGHGGAWFKDAATADGAYGSGNFRIGVDCSTKIAMPPGGDSLTVGFQQMAKLQMEATKGTQGGWFNDNKRAGKGETGYLSRSGSKSSARKAASARIAKIPEVLARHIARTYYPQEPA